MGRWKIISKLQKITLNYFGGSYGCFLANFLYHNIDQDSITPLGDFHFGNIWTDESKFRLTHDDIMPNDKDNIKITYKLNHVDLISRARWQKVDGTPPETHDIFNIKTIEKYDVKVKKIAVMSFYKADLLKKFHSWNKQDHDHVVYVPFDFFLCQLDNWMENWSKIFESLNINVDNEYLADAHKIFNKSQSKIFSTHLENINQEWHNKDLIAKANTLAQLTFKRHFEKNIPIDIPRYSNTTQMLCEWVLSLDANNGDVSQLSK